MSDKNKKSKKERDERGANKDEDQNRRLKECEDKLLKLQAQYRQLYDEYALFRQRAQNREEEVFMDWFGKGVKVMIKMIEDLHKALSQMPREIKNSTWWEGLKAMAKQFEDMIKSLDIHIEDALGKEVDHIYHEPIGIEQVYDRAKKGKIIRQYERGYVYKKGTSEEKILQPAKVIVWQ